MSNLRITARKDIKNPWNLGRHFSSPHHQKWPTSKHH